MTDLSPMIRDAFQDDSLPAADRDRLWSTMQHRQARQARAKLLVRAGLLLLAGFVIAAAVLVRNAIRSSSDPVVPVPVAADSISNNSPVERSMTQETHQEVPSNLIPLLGHRSQLTMDIRSLEDRQLELADKLDETTGREHEVISRQLASVEQQLEATRVAISVIDAQLAGQPVPVPPVVRQSLPIPSSAGHRQSRWRDLGRTHVDVRWPRRTARTRHDCDAGLHAAHRTDDARGVDRDREPGFVATRDACVRHRRDCRRGGATGRGAAVHVEGARGIRGETSDGSGEALNADHADRAGKHW